MKKTKLSKREVSIFCSEMSIIIKSGISSLEGIAIIKEDTLNEERLLFEKIYNTLDKTGSLAFALKESKSFPKYVVDMVEIGEKTGNLDNVMERLGIYYDREDAIVKEVKSAIAYPAMMVLMMLIVIFVLIIKVLPIFNQVYTQLGIEMNSGIKYLIKLGSILNNYSLSILCILLFLTFIGIIFHYTKKGKILRSILGNNIIFIRKYRVKVSLSRFAEGMSMAISSGLDSEESLKLVTRLVQDNEVMNKITKCLYEVSTGMELCDAIESTKLFDGLYRRMITIGFKTGSVDEVFKKVAVHYEEEVTTYTDQIIKIIEPTLVAILSVVVGLILMSVMLPLIGIMSGIG